MDENSKKGELSVLTPHLDNLTEALDLIARSSKMPISLMPDISTSPRLFLLPIYDCVFSIIRPFISILDILIFFE